MQKSTKIKILTKCSWKFAEFCIKVGRENIENEKNFAGIIIRIYPSLMKFSQSGKYVTSINKGPRRG